MTNIVFETEFFCYTDRNTCLGEVMTSILKKQFHESGFLFEAVKASRLEDIKLDFENLAKEHVLNDTHHWILNDIFELELPNLSFPIRSILIIAIPIYAYYNAVFSFSSKEYHLRSPGEADFEKADSIIQQSFSELGYHAEPTWRIPSKRIAVRSGMAKYGRNNITYTDSFGSFQAYMTYFSDLPLSSDAWGEVLNMPECNGCKICQKLCPTGAIKNDQFLIDNSRCISLYNEIPRKPFPEWIPLSAHNMLYDCLICQQSCPMNIGHVKIADKVVSFDEDETATFLSGAVESISPSSLEKLDILGMAENMESAWILCPETYKF